MTDYYTLVFSIVGVVLFAFAVGFAFGRHIGWHNGANSAIKIMFDKIEDLDDHLNRFNSERRDHRIR